MNRRKLKIVSIICVVVILIGSLCAVGIANSVTDGMFSLNTPMKIKINSTVTGTLESKSDYEAFIFDVEKNGALSVNLEHDNFLDTIKTLYVVTLYRILDGETRTYEELTYFESFWDEVISDGGEIGVAPGTYCVVVKPGTGFLKGDFKLSATFTQSNTFEREYNDTKENANQIGIGYGLYGTTAQRSEGYDEDWYVFNLTSNSCINLSFSHDDLTFPKAGWNVKIINDKDQIICDFTSKLTDTLLKTGKLGLRAGTYYVKVESVSAITDTYCVLIGSESLNNHEFELNDTPETAIALPKNVAMGGSLADRLLSLDKDYYKITVPSDGVAEIVFSHEALEGDKNGWNIRVLKEQSDGTFLEIVKKISKWNSSGCTISNLGLSAGEYYILIDGDSLAYNSTSYTCKWTFTARDDYEEEPNGAFATAKDIVGNTKYHGAIISSDVNFDEDYYKFEIEYERNVSLELWHDEIKDDSVAWVASIIDGNGNVVKKLESSLNDGAENTGIVTLKPGTYYVKIETGMYGSENLYWIVLNW